MDREIETTMESRAKLRLGFLNLDAGCLSLAHRLFAVRRRHCGQVG